MTKPGRDADDLGKMLVQMMAAQAAAAAGGAAAGNTVAAAASRSEPSVHIGVTDEEAYIEGVDDPENDPISRVTSASSKFASKA